MTLFLDRPEIAPSLPDAEKISAARA